MSEAYAEYTKIIVNMRGDYLDLQLISGIRQLIEPNVYQLSQQELIRIKEYTSSFLEGLILDCIRGPE